MIIRKIFLGSVVSALVFSQVACVAPPKYSDVVVLSEEGKNIQYALVDDVKSCEKLDVVITGGAKAGEIKDAVSLAMLDARNQAFAFSANKLVYVDTKYTNFFGMNYVGIESDVYKCSIPTVKAEGYVSANANATAEAQAQKQAAQAAALAASQAAMQQAQMQAMMAAQQQQALQQVQQQIQQNQQSINSFKF